MRSALRASRRLAGWLVVGACAAALLAGLLVPRLAGATPYVVLTGSMTPSLPPGTLVVVKPVAPEDIETGDVITYQLRSGEPEVVTHRVRAVRADLRGTIEWQTQGDANDIPDQAWVRVEQVRGTLWYSVPHLGRVSVWVTEAQRAFLIELLAAVLVAYAAAMFFAAWRGKRTERSNHQPDHQPDTPPEATDSGLDIMQEEHR